MSDEIATVALRGETRRPTGQSVLATALGFDEAIGRLKDAISANDLWVIAEIDPQMLLRKGGYAIPRTRQILFFHPRFMARLLSADASAIVEAPLKFVVVETDGGTVVRWPEPVQSFSRYPDLTELASDLGAVVARIAARLRSEALAA